MSQSQCIAITPGSLSGYSNQGCRCDDCRQARSIWEKARYGNSPEFQEKKKKYTKAWVARQIEDDPEYYSKRYKSQPNKYRLPGRNQKLKNQYGISLSEYLKILERQNNQCAVCPKVFQVGNRWFHVDHDHKTGRIRGILCSNCNVALGMLKEDDNIILSLLNYLNKEKYKEKYRES